MGLNVGDVIAGLDPARRRRIEDRAAELIAEEMTLRDLRKARQLTQVSVARELGISQDDVSRLVERADLLLSTLRRTVVAMGVSLSHRDLPRPAASRAVRLLRARAPRLKLRTHRTTSNSNRRSRFEDVAAADSLGEFPISGEGIEGSSWLQMAGALRSTGGNAEAQRNKIEFDQDVCVELNNQPDVRRAYPVVSRSYLFDNSWTLRA